MMLLLPLSKHSLAILSAISVAIALPAIARAQTTVTATPLASVTTGNGLFGSYYGRPSVGTNADADTYIAAHTPLTYFVSSTVIYPQSGGEALADTNTLTTFLGTDAPSLANSATYGSNTLDGQLMEFAGFIHITSSMDLNTGTPGIQVGLGTISDDGSYIRIGSQTVVDDAGRHGAQSASATLTFSSAGYYPLDLRYYEVGGNTGVELDATYAGGASNGTSIVAPNSILNQAAPEPNALTLLGIALPTASFLRRRRNTA